jgi:hypothetical protein
MRPSILLLLPLFLLLACARHSFNTAEAEEVQAPPSKLILNRIPAHLDPTDDAVLATTIDTRFRHLVTVVARAMSPCGNRIAAVCEAEGVIREWDVCSGEEVRQFKLPKVEDQELPEDPHILVPRLQYRAEAKCLLYRTQLGWVTTFSTDDARMLMTHRSNSPVILCDNGQYLLQSDQFGNCSVIDTSTGKTAGSIPTCERLGYEIRSLSTDGRIAVFTRKTSFRIVHWTSDGTNQVITMEVPQGQEDLARHMEWIDPHRFIIPVMPQVLESTKYVAFDVRTDPPQDPVHLQNAVKIRGLQDGVLHALDQSGKPVNFDGTTLKPLKNAVKPWMEKMEMDEGIVDSPLAIPGHCLEFPTSLDGERRFQQLVLRNGKTVDLIEFGSTRTMANRVEFPQLVVTPKGNYALMGVDRAKSFYAYPDYEQVAVVRQDLFPDSTGIDWLLGVTSSGTVWVSVPNEKAEREDCYEIAIPSGEILQKREGNLKLSLDGRWLFSTGDEQLRVSSAMLGGKLQLEEDFTERPFINKQFSIPFGCIGGDPDHSVSSTRNPDDVYVTTDGRVFGIRHGDSDADPRTTLTVRHVDHPSWRKLTHYQLPGTGSISNQYTVCFHPKERLLFIALEHPHTTESELRCYELATLSEVFRYKHPRGVKNVRFDRKGERMLLDHKDESMTVYDFPKFLDRQLKPADAKHWLSDDASLAIPAMRALAKQADAAAVVKQALKQPKRDITAALLNLGDANFRTREAATERLRLLGDEIAPQLQAELDEAMDEEVRMRLTKLVRAAVPMYGLTRQQFRELRAKEVMELIKASVEP